MNQASIFVCRFILAFGWIYHGLFPKLLTVAPTEKAMTATLGFSDEHSFLITKAAGVIEVLLGVFLFIFYQNKLILIGNILALTLLVVFVAVQMPVLLIDAFNPVTTNLSLIGFSYILLISTNSNEKNL